MCSKRGDNSLWELEGAFGFCTHHKSSVILKSWVVAGLMGSFPTLTCCCCYPRSCPCGEHAPHHLHSHRDPRLHPLPRGGRAPGHAGQVEQGWPTPAHREGEQPGKGGREQGGCCPCVACPCLGQDGWCCFTLSAALL